jgi:transcriptional regulator with XRE-family HTH domain
MREEQTAGIPGVAARVREHRRRQGLTQAQLGARVGRSAMWVDRLEHADLEWAARLERGLVEIEELPVLTELAAALGVAVAELSGAPAAAALPELEPRPVRRPSLPRLRRPGMPVRMLAAGAGIGIVITAGAVELGRAGGGGTPHPAAAVAVAAPALSAPPATAVPTPAPTDPPVPTAAPPTPTAAPPTAAATPAVRTPAPTPRPTARVAVATATPSPRVPAAVTVFPSRVLMVVSAGSQSYPTITFTVSNPGSAALRLGALSLTNPGFQGVRDSCSRAVLAPGATCNVTLRVAPPAAGRYTGALVVPVIDGTASTVPLEVDAR